MDALSEYLPQDPNWTKRNEQQGGKSIVFSDYELEDPENGIKTIWTKTEGTNIIKRIDTFPVGHPRRELSMGSNKTMTDYLRCTIELQSDPTQIPQTIDLTRLAVQGLNVKSIGVNFEPFGLANDNAKNKTTVHFDYNKDGFLQGVYIHGQFIENDDSVTPRFMQALKNLYKDKSDSDMLMYTSGLDEGTPVIFRPDRDSLGTLNYTVLNGLAIPELEPDKILEQGQISPNEKRKVIGTTYFDLVESTQTEFIIDVRRLIRNTNDASAIPEINLKGVRITIPAHIDFNKCWELATSPASQGWETVIPFIPASCMKI